MNPDQQSNYWKPNSEDEGSSDEPASNIATVTGGVVEAGPTPSLPPTEESITWEASEYIHQERNTAWFAGVGAAAAVLLFVAIFLMRSYTFALLVVVMAIAVVVLAKRPPRTLKYTLSSKGLYVVDQLHPFAEYKAFGVIHDEGEYSVMLLPTKRFAPSLTVYFPASLGEKIVDFLGQRLPMQELNLDAVDKIVRKLRL